MRETLFALIALPLGLFTAFLFGTAWIEYCTSGKWYLFIVSFIEAPIYLAYLIHEGAWIFGGDSSAQPIKVYCYYEEIWFF